MIAQQDVDPICAATVDQCRDIFKCHNINVVLCDLELSDGTYSDILAAAAYTAKKRPQIVVMSPLVKFRVYNQAKRRGVLDLITTPRDSTDIEWIVDLAKRTTSRTPRKVPVKDC